MNKQEFLNRLREGLCGFPREDIEERLTFYGEMIADRMEDGLSEEEAVAAIGTVEKIVEQIVADVPLAQLAKEKLRSKRRLKAWEIVLLVLGSPIWASLLIAALAVILSLYVSAWAVIVSLWAAFVSVAACALAGVPMGVVLICEGNIPGGVALFGATLVCVGVAIAWFFSCRAITNGLCRLTKTAVLQVKTRLVKKEEA